MALFMWIVNPYPFIEPPRCGSGGQSLNKIIRGLAQLPTARLAFTRVAEDDSGRTSMLESDGV